MSEESQDFDESLESPPDVEAWRKIEREILSRIGDERDFVRAVLSGRRRNFSPICDRIDIKPVLIKNQFFLQLQFTDNDKHTTQNLPLEEFINSHFLASGFANFLVETRTESLAIRIGKKGQVFKKSSRVQLVPAYEHDRKKQRLLEENDPYLIAVGISDSSGRVKPSMRDKYLQVEEFLKILESSCKSLLGIGEKIRVVDLGCGHAYLTFAAVRFFQIRGEQVSFVGVDIKSETRVRNQKIAHDLGIEQFVKFEAVEISRYPTEPTDIVIALHACDTATDDALAWGVNSEAKVILVAPCCHHDLHRQVQTAPSSVESIFEHGILFARQLDLLTDAVRALILRIMGYRAEVFEFISGEHTARNLLIRATRLNGRREIDSAPIQKLGAEYRRTCAEWGISPALAERLVVGTFPFSD